MNPKFNKYRTLCICLVLSCVTLATFWQVHRFDFVTFDDHVYVSHNANIQQGLTPESIHWALTAPVARNWHPMTSLSLLLDYQLFGLNPGAFHLTNLFFHIANTLLLFWVFSGMTRRPWLSAFVAAVFALHPLHVESVAWISERKDVLSTFFWMLTMAAYMRYVRKPGLKKYLLLLSAFVAGLLAKPMLVSLPFVLLLMDYWPLERLGFQKPCHADTGKQRRTFVFLIKEKIPLFILSFAFSITTVLTQRVGGTMSSFEMIPLNIRIANVFVSYMKYIQKMFVPVRLAVLYPHPGSDLSSWLVLMSVLLFVIAFIAIICLSKKCPYLIVGWLWYVGTLIPVIGLVQVGPQAMADRYSYIPLAGLFIIVSWGLSDMLSRWRYKRIVLGLSASLVLVVLITLTHLQLRHWQDGVTLFEHTVNVTDNNYIAYDSLANALDGKGEHKTALNHYLRALQINPNYLTARYNLGNCLARLNRFDEAVSQWDKVLQLDPNRTDARYNMALALSKQGKFTESAQQYRYLLHAEPHNTDVRGKLARAIENQKKQELQNGYDRINASQGDAN